MNTLVTIPSKDSDSHASSQFKGGELHHTYGEWLKINCKKKINSYRLF